MSLDPRFGCKRQGRIQWLRAAARARLASEGPPRLDTAEELRAFFARCDERETRREPDWDEHRRVIERSRLPDVCDP